MVSDEKSVEEFRNHERQMSELEKQSILEFESYLAAATTKKTITVETSLLISQLTTMDPTWVFSPWSIPDSLTFIEPMHNAPVIILLLMCQRLSLRPGRIQIICLLVYLSQTNCLARTVVKPKTTFCPIHFGFLVPYLAFASPLVKWPREVFYRFLFVIRWNYWSKLCNEIHTIEFWCILYFCSGLARRPPQAVIEQVKALNQSLQLGSMLCRSRKPDFLLNIIERQVSQALLISLVFSSVSYKTLLCANRQRSLALRPRHRDGSKVSVESRASPVTR